MSLRLLPLLAAVALLAPAARIASAITVDGRLDPDYGPPLSVQTTQTSTGDNNDGQVGESFGSELDQAFGSIVGDTLYLFLAGNLTYFQSIELGYVWSPVQVFIDSRPGGQHTLINGNPAPEPPGYDVNRLAGLTFDGGFDADYWLGFGATSFGVLLRAYYGELPAGGGGAGLFLGHSDPGSNGVLAGGTNPHGILASIDESNVAGVTSGCGAASGAGAVTGLECAIPLEAIGNPGGCVNVSAFITGADGSTLYNQVLGPLPSGVCTLGAASGVDFSGIPGNQFFTVCPRTVPVRRGTWGALKVVYR